MNQPNYEVPAEMREFAEKSVDQARKAFGGFIGAAHKAVDTMEGSASSVHTNATDMARKTISYAEQNIAAAFDLAQKMVKARDVQEVMQLQGEFMRAQMAAMQNQMRDVGSAMQGQMQEAGATMKKAANEATKAAKG